MGSIRDKGTLRASKAPRNEACSMEAFEARMLLDGMGKEQKNDHNDRGERPEVVYVQSNNPVDGQNAILAYRENENGVLRQIRGGPFKTGGTGYLNDNERLGPDDSDQEIIVSENKRLLFVVNSGSDTISVFRIQQGKHYGRLKLVNVESSGGVQPVSMQLVGNFLYDANRGNQPAPLSATNPGPGVPVSPAGNVNPNYIGFKVSGNGDLKVIPGSNKVQPAGSSPTQVIASPDGKHLFANNFFHEGRPSFGLEVAGVPSAASKLLSFKINKDGSLSQDVSGQAPLPNSPQGGTGFPLILGLGVHPTENILYTGEVVNGNLVTYTYDATGKLTRGATVPTVMKDSAGIQAAGICWIEIDTDAQYIYASNAISNSISVFSIADPFHPVEVQAFALGGPREPVNGEYPAPVIFKTTPFQIELSPDDETLYVVNHETTLNGTYPQGNHLHDLHVGPNGLVSEDATSPTIFDIDDVPAQAHPKGIIVI